MAIIRLQNEFEKNVYYEYDSSVKPLGEGGMGRVFRGKRIETNNQGVVLRERNVAIKCMFDGLPEHVIMRARREASIRIKSLNLIEMIDFVEVRNGQSVYYHVVSELLDGVNLDELLEGRVENHDGSPNPFAKKLYNQYQQNRKAFIGMVFRGLLSGISVLHDQGYIHRDIDHSNIIITSNGDVKLIDFGIAKKIDDLVTTDKQLTTDGQFAGKVCYAAPELVLGDLKHQSYTTDIYALGITLFQFATGHLPFEGPFTEVYKKQLDNKLPLKEINDKALRAIIDKATEKEQKKGYQSASEFRVAIDEWISKSDFLEVPSANSVKPSNDAHEDNKKKRIIIGAAAALVAIVVGAIVLIPKNDKGGEEIDLVLPQEPDSVVYQTTLGQRYVYWGEWDSLYVPNGQGKAVFDFFEYSGSFNNGDLEGYGTMTYTCGELEGHVYEGYFHGSEIDSGCMQSEGHYYVGTFSQMQPWNGILYDMDTSTKKVDSTKFMKIIDGDYIDE